MTPLEAAWSAVLEAPDDDGALCVLGDALLDAGDPQGELIQLQLSGEPVDRELVDALIATHARALLGDERRLQDWAPEFARGFIARAGPIGDAHELAALLTRPVGRLVRKLRVREPFPRATTEIFDVLLAHPPTALEELWIEGIHFERGWGEIALAPIVSRLPRLEVLLVEAAQPNLSRAHSEVLRALSLDLSSGAIGLETARLPRLDELSLTLPFRQLDLPLALLSGEVAPRVRRLELGGALWPTQLQELGVSALLRGLEALTITADPDTGWYPVLLQSPERFAHLARLSVRPDRHHPEWVTALRELLPCTHLR